MAEPFQQEYHYGKTIPTQHSNGSEMHGYQLYHRRVPVPKQVPVKRSVSTVFREAEPLKARDRIVPLLSRFLKANTTAAYPLPGFAKEQRPVAFLGIQMPAPALPAPFLFWQSFRARVPAVMRLRQRPSVPAAQGPSLLPRGLQVRMPEVPPLRAHPVLRVSRQLHTFQF